MRSSIIRSALIIFTSLSFIACNTNETSSTYGYIEGELTYISSSVSGYLDELSIVKGQYITRGQALFALNPEPEKAAVNKAKMELQGAQEQLADLTAGQRATVLTAITAQQQQAQAQVDLAYVTLERSRDLYRKKIIAKAVLDDAIANYDTARKRVEELNANFAEANLGARVHQVKAQQAKVQAEVANLEVQQWLYQQKTRDANNNALVFDTFYHVGEYVPAGRPVLALLSNNNMKLIFYLPQSQLSLLHLGDTVHFTCDNCANPQNSAIVDYISNVAEYTPPIIYSANSRQRLVYRIEGKFEEADALTKFNAGQPVSIQLPAKQETNQGSAHEHA